MDLSNLKAIFFDMDGVLYLRDEPLPYIKETFELIKQKDINFLCLTNSSTKSPNVVSQKLEGFGLDVSADHILTSATATAEWVKENYGLGKKIYLYGVEGLITAFNNLNFDITKNPKKAEIVVAGVNRTTFTFEMLADASTAINNCGLFIATNDDSTYPTPEGPLPGTGCGIAFLEKATSIKARVIGKPHTEMFQIACEKVNLKPEEILMVGDNYKTDILGSKRFGIKTAGITTGIYTREEFESVDNPPDIILENLNDLINLLN